jgi:hypothetical protein
MYSVRDEKRRGLKLTAGEGQAWKSSIVGWTKLVDGKIT